MPNFMNYEVDSDLQVTVDDFINECSSVEITQLIEALIKDDYLTVNSFSKIRLMSASETDFSQKLSDLSLKYYSMSNEDVNRIEELHKKYC